MVKAVDILYLVHVIVVPNNLYLGYASPSFLDGLQQVTLALQNEGEDKGSRLLDQYEKKCQSQGVRCVKMKVSGSSPGDLLCAISKQEEITNLVVGRKSKGSVERFLLGSVSRYKFLQFSTFYTFYYIFFSRVLLRERIPGFCHVEGYFIF
eukprot:TRINITY_DN2881_c0_g1_i1.p1 TRINITY_DN2881_c0_g1~~TRINITY_DN2881_c0_g1_i1.p1  ORF type:complete len:151 (-),score=32.59 TRINITY_DN2881_c0_g1_i1:286-738(-)